MKKKPLWMLILADSLILGAALVVFALFHHVLPHQKTSLGIVSVQPSPQSGTTQAPSSFSLIGTALAEESVPDTERTLAEDQGLTLSERSCLNGTVQYYLADLTLSDATALKTAFAYDTYGGGFAQTVSEMARQQDALAKLENIDGFGAVSVNKLYAAKPAWQPMEGTIIAAVKWAEKEIPDNTPNKALVRLNAALGYVVKVYEQARGPATEQVKAELREGIQIVHAELEAAGNLDKAPLQEAAA